MDDLIVCRVCLNEDPMESKHKYSLINNKYKDVLLFEHIQLLSGVETKYQDGLSNYICSTCVIQLQTAVDFREKCIKSDTILKKQTKSKISVEKLFKFEKEEINESVIKVENLESEAFEHYNDIEFIDYRGDDFFMKNITGNTRKSRAVNLNLECHDCGDKFKSKCKLRVHWKKVHMYDKLICKSCKRAFKSFKAFETHQKNGFKSCATATSDLVSIEGIGKGRVFECKECKYRTKRIKDMSAHLVIHTGERPFQCHLCPNNYTQHSSLQNHWEYAHKKFSVEITCQYCGKYLKGRRAVYRHLKSHTEEKISCHICSKIMTKKSFSTHMKRHSGVKSFTCEVCASSFYTSAELCNHKRLVHRKGSKVYKCSQCDYSSIREVLLKRHQAKHTGSNFSCLDCGRFYPTTEKLLLHRKIHFEGKKYNCPQCDKSFYHRDSVKKHLNKKHVLIVLSKSEPNVEVKTENSGHDEVKSEEKVNAI